MQQLALTVERQAAPSGAGGSLGFWFPSLANSGSPRSRTLSPAMMGSAVQQQQPWVMPISAQIAQVGLPLKASFPPPQQPGSSARGYDDIDLGAAKKKNS